MEELISRSAALKAAREGFCHPGIFCPDTGCKELEPLKRIPAAERWIPCSERLPEEGVPVLVSVKWDEDNEEACIAKRYDDGYLFDNYGLSYAEIVQAWMPLPEPYKGEQDEG